MLFEIELFQKKQKQKQNTTKKKRKKKKRKEKKRHQIALSLGYPNFYFYKKDVICCSNGYSYHFLDYIRLLLFANANVIHHV